MTEEQKKRMAEIEALTQAVEAGMKKRGLLDQMEDSVESEKQALGQRLFDEKLHALPAEGEGTRACPKCGVLCRVRKKDVPRTFRSLSGTHTFKRNYHYCESCKEGFCPRDEELGLPKDTSVSNEVARRLCDFYLNSPYEVAEERWPVHYKQIPASANLFRQEADRLAELLEETNEALLQSSLKPPSTQGAEVLYVQNDGSMVSMRGGEWREVKSAVLFESEHHLKGTESKRGEISEARYVSVLGSQEEFKAALRPALKLANAMAASVIIWLADGAKGNWNLASLLCPRAKQILDWYHAIKAASDCAKLLFDNDEACAASFCERVSFLLNRGEVKQCLRELMACLEFAECSAQLKAINDLVGYYRANQSRMKYDEYLVNGWLIGSGAIESTHRHVIQARMKLAGQHWGERGGRRMARMRAAYKTAGSVRFLDAVHWAHRASRQNQTVGKPMKRRASNR